MLRCRPLGRLTKVRAPLPPAHARLLGRQQGWARGSRCCEFGVASTLRCRAPPLHAQVRVYHDSTGASPSWFLEAVRVRGEGERHWTTFVCGRWLAVGRDDG